MKKHKITYWFVIALGLMWTIPFLSTLAHHAKPTPIEVGRKALGDR